MKVSQLVLLLLTAVSLNGCFLNRPESVQHVVKDFNLGWQGNPKHRSLFVNIDHSEYGGLKIIDETVFAIGYDQNFIIAYQHQILSGNNSQNHQDTIFYIIDIRDYSERFWGLDGNVYKFDSSTDYLQKKREIGALALEIKSVD